MYAVIKTGGKQYKVKPGDRLKIEKIEGEVDKDVKFEEVLAVYDDKEIHLGTPNLKAEIRAKILSFGRAKKVIVFKYKPKKDYRKKRGHRQSFAEVEIETIKLDGKIIAKFERPVKLASGKKEEAPAKEAKEVKVETAEKKITEKKETSADKKPVKKTTAKTENKEKTAPKKAAVKKEETKQEKKPAAKKTEDKKEPAKKAVVKKEKPAVKPAEKPTAKPAAKKTEKPVKKDKED